jgi:hypothetical protein
MYVVLVKHTYLCLGRNQKCWKLVVVDHSENIILLDDRPKNIVEITNFKFHIGNIMLRML